MKCQILILEKNKKNISKCRLLKILPRVLSVIWASYDETESAVFILVCACVHACVRALCISSCGKL